MFLFVVFSIGARQRVVHAFGSGIVIDGVVDIAWCVGLRRRKNGIGAQMTKKTRQFRRGGGVVANIHAAF